MKYFCFVILTGLIINLILSTRHVYFQKKSHPMQRVYSQFFCISLIIVKSLLVYWHYRIYATRQWDYFHLITFPEYCWRCEEWRKRKAEKERGSARLNICTACWFFVSCRLCPFEVTFLLFIVEFLQLGSFCTRLLLLFCHMLSIILFKTIFIS